MGKQIPMGGIKTAVKLDPGNWTGVIEDVSDDEASQDGKYRIRVVVRTTAPIAGLVHYENYNVGTNDDPTADDPATWTDREINGNFNPGAMAASRFKRLMMAAECPSADAESLDIDELKGEAPGRPIDFTIEHRLPKGDDGQPDTTANPFVNIKNTYKAGTLTPGLATAQAATSKPQAGQRAQAARPQVGARPAPVVGRPVAPGRPASPAITRTISRPAQAVEVEDPEAAQPPATKRG